MEHLSMNTIASKVEKAEAIGRQYFRQIVGKVIPGYKELVFSDNQYSKWDGAIKGKKSTKYFVEIKVRNMSSSKYNDYMIEEKKMNYLLEMYDKEGYIPLYVNFFEDGKALVWNLAEEREIKYLKENIHRIE